MAIWTARDMPQQDGKRVLVTGGVAGIGFQVAKAMGEKGARVLIASRDIGKGARALAELRAVVPAGEFSFGRLDLADLGSVAEFTDGVLGDGEPLDYLMNVAGVMALPKRTLTKDGFEMHMGTNYFGHFALTGRLLPLLKAARGRVVTVSARAASWYKLDLTDLQFGKKYGPMRAYGLSKLAGLLFATELNERGTAVGVSSIGVDPGTAKTGIQRHAPDAVRWIGERLMDTIGYPLDRVADTVVFAATVAKAGPEAYIGPTTIIQSRGSPGYIRLPKAVLDRDLREDLWERGEALTGVRYDFP